MSAMSVQPWRTFTLASMAIFIVTLDATIVFAAFPALWASFTQTSAGDVSWVLTAYTIVYALCGLWFFLLTSATVDYLRIWRPGMLLSGLGVGLALPSLAGAAVASLAPNRFGVGSALNLAIRQFGSALGAAFTVAMVGEYASVENFRNVFLFLIAGGLLTSALSLPIVTHPRPGALPFTPLPMEK
ncbi:MAG: hypothetical protein ACSLFL_02415 [Alphaproteobacteria bacterium]